MWSRSGRGCSRQMSAGSESSIMAGPHREKILSALAACVNSRRALSRGLFKPWALVFIGLSLSVTLWGFGYKLSRYNPHSDAVSRALLAKLWDKHQDVTQVTAAAEACAQVPQSAFALDAALILLLCQLPDPERRRSADPDRSRPLRPSLHPLVPLRSPPPSTVTA